MVQVSIILMLCLITGLFARKYGIVARIFLVVLMGVVVLSLLLLS